MEENGLTRAEKIRLARQGCPTCPTSKEPRQRSRNREAGPKKEGIERETRESSGISNEIIAKIAVACGIFLLAFFLQRYEKSNAIATFVSSNQQYENTIETIATWVNQQTKLK